MDSNSNSRAGREQVTPNENANAKRRPINWTSIVTDDKGSETGCERLSDIRVKSESCKLKMNSGESFNGTPNVSPSVNNGGNAPEPSSPLDFSLKKRKLNDTDHQKLGNNKNGGSAFEAFVSNSSTPTSLLGSKSTPTTLGFGHLLTGQSPTNSSPFLLNPSMFPLSLAAAASVHQNFGAAVASVSNNHQQHQLSSTTVDCASRKPIGPLNSTNGSLLAQHLAAQPQPSQTVRNQRPFKAYDPMKPGSALNVLNYCLNFTHQ